MNEGHVKAEEQGAYTYLLNGEPTEIVETWARARIGIDEQQLISVRKAASIEIHVLANIKAGQVHRCEVSWFNAGIVRAYSEFKLTDEQLSVHRQVGNRAATNTQISLDHSPHFLSPLLRVFSGPVIAGLLQSQGEGVVILPDIESPSDTQTLLCAKFSRRRARVLEADARVEIGGRRMACRLCEYTGDQYGAGTQFWLGANDLLLRYQWQQSPEQLWDVRLTA